MSFNNNGIKPKLVENKVVEKIIKAQNLAKPYDTNKILSIILSFLYKHILSVSLISFIVIILVYRYYDVQSKKRYSREDSETQEEIEEEEVDSSINSSIEFSEN
jgi:uncharacterized membrane protein